MKIKSEIHHVNILNAALDEFYKHGFQMASMRHIAKSAKMTAGKIYCYFEKKESLFKELVEESYERILELADTIGRAFVGEYLPAESGIIEQFTKFANFTLTSQKNLIILFDGSAGTSYSNTKSIFRQRIEQSIEKYFANKLEQRIASPFTDTYYATRLISNSLLEGLIQIFRDYKSPEWAVGTLSDLLLLHISGLNALHDSYSSQTRQD